MTDSHSHRCRDGHTWEHTGPTSRACRIPEYSTALWGRHTSVEHCPICTGRDDLLTRGPHAHHCAVCQVDWTHEGRCTEGPDAQCAWCGPQAGIRPAGWRQGLHVHQCLKCFRMWEHAEPCAASHRGVLPDCPGCGTTASRSDLERSLAQPSVTIDGGVRGRWPRRVGVVALVVVAGLGLAVVSAQFLAPRPGDRAETPRVTTAITPPAAPPTATPPPRQDSASPTALPIPPPVAPATPPVDPPPADSPPRETERPDAPPPATSPALPSVGPQPKPAVPAPPVTVGRIETPEAGRVPDASAPKRPAREAMPAGEPGSSARSASSGRTAADCLRPAAPTVLISNESGRELGLWVGVEVDPTPAPGRCLYVIRRHDETLWVINSAKVRAR